MTSSPRRSRILAAALAGALVSTGVASGALAERSESDAELLLEQKVDPDIIEEIDETGETELWLRFTGAPDWSDAVAATDKEEKGEAALDAALEYAEDSQAEVVDALEAADAEYETFWGSSTVKVVGDQELLEELVAFDKVEEVVEAPEYEPIEPISGEKGGPGIWGDVAESLQDGPDWNLDQIGAPEAWADGFTGEGIVVASLDSGVQYDHPALVEQYRGNNGDGTFTHDYNFFDTIDECEGPVPCDIDGHGTHTMGTMVGDDGMGNQIGVAPDAEWIAVTAGDFELDTLLTAGEWIAAPTDSNGENPDPAMAPHIVNNSWGSLAGYDPFYADVVDLWHAAGIIPVFAAGNSGDLGCLSVGSPGVYENVIAVGATDVNGEVTVWSSKGPGMDAVIKPDVAAPGDEVRSSLPGDAYGLGSGTSMAAPHVVGAIALMMSASPVLEGDYENVYKYLTRNADHVDDQSCRGNDKANNVYGYGRTDVVAAIDGAPNGRFGSLAGVVTDDSGEALSGARLVFAGSVNRVMWTDAEGGYAFDQMPTGLYKVTVSKFTYESVSGTVRVKRNGEAVFDAALTALPARTVEGAVVDGSGHGWGVPASVATAAGETYAATDPLTGEFSLRIPEEGDWPLTVRASYRGYETVVVDPDDAAVVELSVTENCNAPGYGSETLYEDFGSMELPEGWSVENNGEADPWVFGDPYEYGNLTPGVGGFAQANSDAVDPELSVDTDMVTAPFDLSAAEDPTLQFASFFIDFGIGGEADIEISTDGGETWEQAWSTTDDLFESVESVDLSAWAAETSVQLKFHYADNDTWAYFWQVDDVRIGCDVLDGGLVTGIVADEATGEPVRGATVTDQATGASAVTDWLGRYVLFTDAGATTLEAEAPGFDPAAAEVEVVADAVVGSDFNLS